jgi:PTS system nitrogen regulatory IIA component
MLCLPGADGLTRLAPFAEAVYRLHQVDGVVGDGLPGPQPPGAPAPLGLVAGWPVAPDETQALLAYASHSRVPAYLLRNPVAGGRYRRVIAATAGGVHALHLLSLAQALAREWGVPATVLWLEPPAGAGEPDAARERLETLLARSFALEPAVEFLRAGDIVRQLDTVAGAEDLLLVGAPHFGVAAYHYEGSLPDQLARLHRGPMAMCLSEPPQRLAFREFLWEANICFVADKQDGRAVIARLTDRLCASGILPVDLRQACIEAALARERLASTAVGSQTALPHARLPRFDGVAAALAVAPGGIDFGAEREPPRFVFLMLTSATSYGRYLGALARIARLMVNPERRQALLGAPTSAAVMTILETEPPAE